MTTQQLSNATDELGHRVPRSVLANIEHERRDAISVAELLVIAAALDVPPVVLITPVGRRDEVEPLPSLRMTTWSARGWLLGASAPRYLTFSLSRWMKATRSTRMYDEHRLLVRGYQAAMKRLTEMHGDHMDVYPGRSWPEEVIELRKARRNALLQEITATIDQIKLHRGAMENEGIRLPELPADLLGTLEQREPGGRHRDND